MDAPPEVAKADPDAAEPISDAANEESTAATDTGEPESPLRTWSSSSESSKESPPPLAVPPPAASIPGSTPTGPSTRTRAQQASTEKELRASQSRDKTVPPAKKKLKTNPPSASSSSEEEDPMEVSSNKSASLHSEKDSEDTKLEPKPPRSKYASAAKASTAAKGKQPMEEPSSGNVPSSLSGCPQFYYRDNERDWNLYDFYANLTDDFLDENSRLYRRVYVRGHWFSFSEKDIAQALQLPKNVSNAVMSMDPELLEVKSEVQNVNNRLAAMEEVQYEMSKQLTSLVKFYRD
ncbi:uncharacterized protein LOC115720164 [Cannabis sativa]|uniref:uncharacterized protein LOC115720164 n=1 Tax=Cannabis sativa TaxID=3483 RepID=UPI0029C9F0FD|nr:uncharacterized protein LOC115720164 [Cannabis sativa]